MQRYIVSEQLDDGTWYGRGSITAISPEAAIEKIKSMLDKTHDRWQVKKAKKATYK